MFSILRVSKDTITLRVLFLHYSVGQSNSGNYAWLSARGNGTNLVWERSGHTISNTDPLWAPGYPDSSVTSNICLVMLGDMQNFQFQSLTPYFPSDCTINLYTLCECKYKVHLCGIIQLFGTKKGGLEILL